MLATSGLALSLHAVPTPIDGTISFAGSATIDATDFVTATQFTAFNAVTVGDPSGQTGDYIGTSGAPVTMSTFVWDPPTTSTPVLPLWTFMSGGNTYTFDMHILDVDAEAPDSILLSGFGTAFITGPGFDKLPTQGVWNFSAQTQGQATFTFSSTTSVPHSVPDGGATWAMLSSVLFGFGLLRRK